MTVTYILSAKRTPIGKFSGGLSSVPAPKLGAVAIESAIKEASVEKDQVSDVIFGNVLTSGVGQAPARQASIYAGLSKESRAVTINKVCGSGLYTVIAMHNQIRLGETALGVAGGQENMSMAPFILPKARNGFRLGHAEVVDSLIHDGLWDPYDNLHMGSCAEICAKEMDFTKEKQDNFALESYARSRKATESGQFKDEIAAVEVAARKKTILVEQDEEPFSAPLEKLPKLRPAFEKDGTVTAGNASSINDGAAALVLASEDYVKKHNLKPLAKIVDYTIVGQEPKWFTTAPVKGMKELFAKTGLTPNDIDLFEVNEAFAVVTMAAIKEFELDQSKVNIFGGAVSLGHPIGASGARILVTLVNALRSTNKKRGIASICIGGGEAASLLIENCS